MTATAELNELNEKLLAARADVEKAKQDAENARKVAEEALGKAQRAEERAKKNYERFIRHSFLTQLKTFLDGAPVVLDVFNHDENHKLPPEDEPDKYGCRFTVTVYQKSIYVNGEYASVNPIKEDFFDVYNGQPPVKKPYDGWSPSIDNIPFMPKKTHTKWIPSRYIPIHKFEQMEEIFQRNYDKYIAGVKSNIAKWKNEMSGAELYSAKDENDDYLHVICSKPFDISWNIERDWFSPPKKYDAVIDEPFTNICGYETFNRKQVTYEKACKILDNIVAINDAYFKCTMKEAKEWFNHCKELVKKDNEK